MLKKVFSLPIIQDERGALLALENNKEIPFESKRVYFLFNLKADLPRGFHAHKELIQLMVCIKGSCTVKLDDGEKSEYVYLNKPIEALLIDKMVWHEMENFSEDCIIMVLASDYYDENDYIRNYQTFLGGLK